MVRHRAPQESHAPRPPPFRPSRRPRRDAPCLHRWGLRGDRGDDGDGAPASEDCDDTNPDVHPGAPDACDDIDNDCDGTTDEDAPVWYADEDGDGFGDMTRGQVTCSQPAGAVTDATDCDDTRAHLHPYDDDGDGTAEGCGWREVSAGGYHTCAIDSDGEVVCWGLERDGQCEVPAGVFRTVSAGLEHTCAIGTDGAVQCWGDAGDGRSTAPSGNFAAVAAGGDFSCAVGAAGSVVCWGGNRDGQIDPPEGNFSSLDAGMAGNPHACGLAGDGSLSCWGYGGHGQTTVPAGSYAAVSTGGSHTCAIETGPVHAADRQLRVGGCR
jgi:hypothetical protein